jgi:hypothetical protein
MSWGQRPIRNLRRPTTASITVRMSPPAATSASAVAADRRVPAMCPAWWRRCPDRIRRAPGPSPELQARANPEAPPSSSPDVDGLPLLRRAERDLAHGDPAEQGRVVLRAAPPPGDMGRRVRGGSPAQVHVPCQLRRQADARLRPQRRLLTPRPGVRLRTALGRLRAPAWLMLPGALPGVGVPLGVGLRADSRASSIGPSRRSRP